MDVNQRGNRTILLAAGNSTGPIKPELVTTQQKLLQCVIPTGFTGVTAKIQGTNDGANWIDMESFSASGAVVNTDPFRIMRGNLTALSGSGAVAAGVTPVRHTDSAGTVSGGTLDYNKYTFYRDNGILYKLTTTTFAIGDWILAVSADAWNGRALPVVDEGTTETLLFDLYGETTARYNLKPGTAWTLGAAVIALIASY